MTVYERAVALYHAQRWDEAIAICRNALAEQPAEPGLLNLLGVSLVSAGRPVEAAGVLTRAVESRPDHPGALANLALTLHDCGRLEEARFRYRQLATMEPQNPVACSRLALLLQEEGDLEAARRWMERAAVLAPMGGTQWSNLAAASINAGELAKADRALARALAINPADSTACVTGATIQLRLGNLAAAEVLTRRAQTLDPETAELANVASRCRSYRTAVESAEAGARMDDPPGLVLRGPFDTPSGYAHMGRRTIQTLRQQGVPLQVIGLLGQERWRAEALDVPVPARAAVNIMIPLALEPIPGLATILYSMFEGPRVPQSWVKLSEPSDLVIVPTQSSRIAWIAQGFPEDRVRICPLGVDPEAATADAPPLVLVDHAGRHVSSYRHRFLNVSDNIPRKNLDGLLRVWLRATQRTDDAVLILKPGKGGASAVADVQALVRQTEAHVGRRFAEAAPILVVDRYLDEAQITGLFRAANHYWSMSHGEGWDLPMARAGAMGLGLIAPRHSAYVDYLDASLARMIPAVEAPARKPYSEMPWAPFFGLDWWQPDEDAAAAILDDILHDRGPALSDPSGPLLARFSWNHAAHKLRGILADMNLLANPGSSA